MAATPLGPAEPVTVTSWVPDADAVSAGADRLTDGATLSTSIALDVALTAPVALVAL